METLELLGKSAPLAPRRLSSPVPATSAAQQRKAASAREEKHQRRTSEPTRARQKSFLETDSSLARACEAKEGEPKGGAGCCERGKAAETFFSLSERPEGRIMLQTENLDTADLGRGASVEERNGQPGASDTQSVASGSSGLGDWQGAVGTTRAETKDDPLSGSQKSNPMTGKAGGTFKAQRPESQSGDVNNPSKLLNPPCSPRAKGAVTLTRSRSLPASSKARKSDAPLSPVRKSSTVKPGDGDAISPRERPSCKSPVSPSASKSAVRLLSPRVSSQSKNVSSTPVKSPKSPAKAKSTPSNAPLSPRTTSQTKVQAKSIPELRTKAIKEGDMVIQKVTSTPPSPQSEGLSIQSPSNLSSPAKPTIHSPSTLSPPRAVRRSSTTISSAEVEPPGAFSPPRVLGRISTVRSSTEAEAPGALSPPRVLGRSSTVRSSTEAEPPGALSPPRALGRSATLRSSTEGEPRAVSPPTSPESAARAEQLRRQTQLRLEKWRLDQEANALKAKRLEDGKREDERRRREIALESKERRRAEIYALNRKLREEEERRVEAYRQERERRLLDGGTATSSQSTPLEPSGGHHLAA